jgi:hypothetical protein
LDGRIQQGEITESQRVRDRQRRREKRELGRRSRLLWCNNKLFAGDPRLHLWVVIEDQRLGAECKKKKKKITRKGSELYTLSVSVSVSVSLSLCLSGSCTLSLSVSLWEKLKEQRRAGRA